MSELAATSAGAQPRESRIGIGRLVGVPIVILVAYGLVGWEILQRHLNVREIQILNLHDISRAFGQHLLLTFTALTIALVIALPLGVLLARSAGIVRTTVFTFANLSQAIPSVALLGLAYVFLGSGPKPAIFALSAFSVLPILRNTVVGLTSIDPAITEAARGMGMSPLQGLFRVELPLALPVIFAGVRTAVVLNISSATLATFIGGGGLGDILDAGINSNLGRVTLVGAVLVSTLAMFVDWVASLIEAELVART
jgi:osmoprotectant transport system permease protein